QRMNLQSNEPTLVAPRHKQPLHYESCHAGWKRVSLRFESRIAHVAHAQNQSLNAYQRTAAVAVSGERVGVKKTFHLVHPHTSADNTRNVAPCQGQPNI